MADDGPPTRKELLKAREDLEEQIARVSSPMMSRDRNPGLVAQLQAMLDEIDQCLADMEEDSEKR
jgi:hypothetical protein